MVETAPPPNFNEGFTISLEKIYKFWGEKCEDVTTMHRISLKICPFF